MSRVAVVFVGESGVVIRMVMMRIIRDRVIQVMRRRRVKGNA